MKTKYFREHIRKADIRSSRAIHNEPSLFGGRLAFTLTFILFTLSCSNGCRTETKVAQASQDLAAKITQGEKAQVLESKPSTTIEESRVYIDSSKSMAGFVDSNNHTKFDELLDAIGDDLPGCLLFKYGQLGETPPQEPSQLMKPARFGSELHDFGFYNLTYNPDDRLVEMLASEERPVRSVLITDGVYSQEEGSTSPPVVNAIQKWMQLGRTLGVFILRSRFNGPFYSELRRGFLPHVTVEDRPFYLFVFSPTIQGIKELQEKLQRRFPEMRALVFSNDAIGTEIDWEDRPQEISLSAKPPSKGYYWQMFNRKLFAQRSLPTLTYTLRLAISQDYPATELEAEPVIEYYRWERTGFRKMDEGAPQGFNARIEPESQARQTGGQTSNKDEPNKPAGIKLILNLAPDRSSDYGFYHFKVNFSVKDLQADILELSTRDDSRPINANKTYRFYEFMSSLSSIHFKAQLSAKVSRSLFVTVTNP